MSFSFSVGDFVACLTLIKDISDALNNSSGSEADFKALFATLKSLENAFKICQLVYQQCEEPHVQPEVQMQAGTIRQALLDEHQRCRNILEGFVASLSSYTAAFVDDRSKAMALARHMRKITWPSRKADVANLERNLRGHLNSLQMYAAALCQLYLAANTKIVTSTESKVDSILANVTDLRAEVTTIFAGVQISNSRRLRGVGNIWEGASDQLDIVILNDAIGRTVPLPIMLLSSRTALHNVVLWMFHDRDIPGRAKVRRKEYTITDEDADGILIEEANWDMIYHPGKHLSLNMVFPALPSWNFHRCPRCDRPAIGKARPGERRHCAMCQLSFAMFDRERVVEEIPDAKPDATSDAVSEDVMEAANSLQQKNRKNAKDALQRDQKSKKDREEHFLFRNIHYHREILVSKALTAPNSSAEETHREFGIDELPPLHQAAAKASLKVIADLLEKGMDVNEKIPFSMQDEEHFEFYGASPLLIAAWFGKTKVIDLLLEHGANINSLDADNSGILQYAMDGPCRGRIVMPLLSYGADPNIKNRWGSLPLHIAARQGISLLIHPLVEAGNDLNDRNSSGSTALEMASYYGHEQAVQALLDLGADTTICEDICQWNPLHSASYNGSEAVVDMLLQEAPNLKAPDVDGDTALHLAALKNRVGAAKLLLASGADVTAKNNNRETPLHRASTAGGFEIAKLLIENGADVLASCVSGESPLDRAAYGGHDEIALLLLDHGADVNSLDKLLYSPLHCASLNGHDTTVRLLLQHGANPNLVCTKGNTALHLAMGWGHESIAKYLLELDTTVINISDEDGYSCLHYAAMLGLDLLVKLLLDGGLDIEALPSPPPDPILICGTPLVLASRNGKTTAAKELLDRGANIDAICTRRQESSLHMAVKFDHASTVKLLVERGASIECRDGNEKTPLISGSIEGSKSIEILLDAGADVNAVDDYGSTALHLACDGGHETVVKQLLGSGAQYRKDNNGRLPLHDAVNGASSEPIVQLLLQHFPDSVNERNVNGGTALHYAASKGNLPLVNLLLKNGADMETENNFGEIPLDHAVYSGSEPIVQLLLQQSPHTIKARAKDGETLLHRAVREGHLSIIKLLLMTEPTLLEAANNTGQTALFLAVSMGRKEIIEFLLQHGCQLTLRNIDGGAPWDFVQTKVPTSEIIDLLVTYGWDMDERYHKGCTMFHVAVIAGNEEWARSLISRGCNIEIGNADGDTPLNIALMMGNVNMQTLIREALEARK